MQHPVPDRIWHRIAESIATTKQPWRQTVRPMQVAVASLLIGIMSVGSGVSIQNYRQTANVDAFMQEVYLEEVAVVDWNFEGGL